MISVVTPSHDPSRLDALYASLKTQSAEDWEWVVVPNGPKAGAVAGAAAASGDPRVRICPAPGWLQPGVGALKRFAFESARGDVLVEADHDDWLDADCLALVREAVEDRGAGFVYSECLGLQPDGANETYSAEHGWEYADVEYRGRVYHNPVTFPVTARSLCEIYYCPNHVRAWSRAAYRAAGGHDAGMPLADDHDLMCRTYLTGTKFVGLGRVLYYQHRHPAAASIRGAREIAGLTAAVRDRHLHHLVFEWCRRARLPMIDLGGGHGCPRDLGFVALDREGGPDVEYPVDVLSDAFLSAIPDDSVGCFRASDFLEHVPAADVPELMNRLYDKLAPGGFLLSATPAVSDAEGRVGRGAFQDPTHCSFWSPNNFWYYTDRRYSRYVPKVRCRFQAVRCETRYPSEWHRQNHIPYVVADLMAVKGSGRVPGRVLI